MFRKSKQIVNRNESRNVFENQYGRAAQTKQIKRSSGGVVCGAAARYDVKRRQESRRIGGGEEERRRQ